MDINIRIADKSDLDVLVKLYYDFYRELRDKQGGKVKDVKKIEASVKRYTDDPHCVIF